MTGMISGMIDGMRHRLAAAVLWGALAAVALSLIAMCVVAAIVFALIAIYLNLSSQMPLPAAAAVTAGIAVLLAVMIAGTGILVFWISSRPHPPVVRPKADSSATGTELRPLAAAADEAAGWIEKNPLAAILAAFVTGSAFAASPQLRRTVTDLIVAATRSAPPRDP